MRPHDFRHAEVYFQITYPDVAMNYPVIRSFVFVGTNLCGDDPEDTWYFQWATDFGRFGAFTDTKQSGMRVTTAVESELGNFLDLDALTEALNASEVRRHAAWPVSGRS